MNSEEVLLSTLIDGTVRQSQIPLAKTTRFRAARKLEAEGKLLREKDGWRLSRAGLHYAIKEYGIMPAPRNYFVGMESDAPQIAVNGGLEYRTYEANLGIEISPIQAAVYMAVVVAAAVLGLWLGHHKDLVAAWLQSTF